MRDIIRYLLRRKTRTALTMLAVIVGIFAVTAVGGITEQLESTIRTTEQDALRRITVTGRDFSPVSDAGIRQLRRIPGVAGITESVYDFLKEQDEEAVIQISVNPQLFMATRSDIPGLEYEPPIFGTQLWGGRLPQSRTETVITWALAQARGLELGDRLIIRERPFTVVGIWEDAATMDSPVAVIDYGAAEDLLGETGLLRSVYVIPFAAVNPEDLARRIEEEMPELQADSPTEMLAQARQQMLLFSLIVGASGIVSLLIGTFTIVNSMIVSVQERRQEIGLKKALGAEDGHILIEVVAEAVLIAGVGGLVGMLLGAGVGWLANRVLVQQLGTRLFLLTPRLALGVVAFSAAMGVIAGAYPAWRAAHLDPIIALRGLGGGASYAGRGLKRFIYLIRRNARGILTIGGIAIGIFALVLLGSLSEALNTSLNNVTEGTRRLFMVTPKRADVATGRGMGRVLQMLEGVQDVILTNTGEVTFNFDNLAGEENSKQVQVWAHESLHGDWGFAMPVRNRLAQGRFFASGSTDELVLGAGIAELRGLEVGATVWIKGRPFTVVGIWRKIPFDVFGHDNAAFMSLEALSRIQNGPEVAGVAIRAGSEQDFQRLQTWVEREFAGVDLVTTDEIFGSIRQALATLFAVMGGIFSIAVFVGAVSVANTMVIAVNEQIPEIGLKKAVGAEDGDILAEMLLQAAKLGLVGGSVGVALAWIATLVINPLVKAQLEMDILHLSPRLAVAGLIFSLVLGMIAGLLPARRAAQLDPVVALHAE
ncbi:MAG: Macrolide export ATP-binding/permease protein MacB [Chloroflexi bacterium ADurb.Bin360]|nr:MAG: Macrolide export ATP-binding/permease protein MacB [Chloroflexi bacterium ADurb.Bin360]